MAQSHASLSIECFVFSYVDYLCSRRGNIICMSKRNSEAALNCILLFGVVFLNRLFQNERNKMQENLKNSQEHPQKTRNSQDVNSENGNSPKDFTWFSQKIMFSLMSSTWHLPTHKQLVWKFLLDRNSITAQTTVQSVGQNATIFSMQK